MGDEDLIQIECNQGDVDTYLHLVSMIFSKTNSLIIIDDCASSQEVKNRTGELVNLAFSAQHLGLSTIVITQQLTSIAKPYRENISRLTTFYNANKSDMKSLMDDYLNGTDKKELQDIVQKLKTKKYARLEILLRNPNGHKTVVPR